jgi:hypothetical protein
MELYDVKDYEGIYKIDKEGNIFSIKRKIYMKSSPDKDGYLRVGLRKDNKQKLLGVHRLVCLTFRENPNNLPVVDHIDRNKKNNTLENLRWITISGNSRNVDVKKKFRGVRETPSGKYRADIKINNKTVYLGTFKTEEEAEKCFMDKHKKCLKIFDIINGSHL